MSVKDDTVGPLPTVASADIASELLVTELLEGDLRSLLSAQRVDRLTSEDPIGQYNTEIDSTANASCSLPMSESFCADQKLALELFHSDLRLITDTTYAKLLQSNQAASLADLQLALGLSATESKLALDFEFAKQLQESDVNRPTDDVDSVLGKDKIHSIIASNPNDTGSGMRNAGSNDDDVLLSKGKGRASSAELFDELSSDQEQDFGGAIIQTAASHNICGICQESTSICSFPIGAQSAPSSSSDIRHGLQLSCPVSHAYCVGCITIYILQYIDPMSNGSGSPEQLVFPIPCPGCLAEDITEEGFDGITDDDADRALSETALELWYQQRRFDAVRRVPCVNRSCLSTIEVPRDATYTRADCKSCGEAMCVPCHVRWHENLSCERYQALPVDERSPEDRLMLDLAKAHVLVVDCGQERSNSFFVQAQKWKRCPSCKIFVSLTTGCNHMVCRCGTHFCFKCGALADRKNGQCLRKNPSCDLWDEDMLLEEAERGAGRADMNDVVAFVAEIGPDIAAAAQAVAPNAERELFHWLHNPSPMARRQRFTNTMLGSVNCGYCSRHFDSVQALQQHVQEQFHEVYACCGRFYPTVHSLRQHRRQGAWLRHVDYFNNRE